MTADLQAPLVAADVDLRDFAFMPLDVARLRDSDLASDETPESCWAAVLLWCASWHQVPAASIPDSDQWQAKQAGYVSRGRIDAQWAKVREGALRGWIACSDGRLYHPVVAEKARDAWKSKLIQRHKTECARIKKHNQRNEINLPLPDLEAWIAEGCPSGHALPVPKDKLDVSQGHPQSVPRETPSKGQGEGQGQGQGQLKEKEMESAQQPRAAAASPPSRGSRLPAGWTPEPAHMAFAESLGLSNGRATAELEKFRDYWAAQPGQKGVKSDWPATWRNWARRAAEDAAKHRPVATATGETPRQRAARERVYEMTGGLVSAMPPGQTTEYIDVVARPIVSLG